MHDLCVACTCSRLQRCAAELGMGAPDRLGCAARRQHACMPPLPPLSRASMARPPATSNHTGRACGGFEARMPEGSYCNCTSTPNCWPRLQAQKHRERPYDQLVIETTGMANPLPIMQVFSIPDIADHMTLVRACQPCTGAAALQLGACPSAPRLSWWLAAQQLSGPRQARPCACAWHLPSPGHGSGLDGAQHRHTCRPPLAPQEQRQTSRHRSSRAARMGDAMQPP